MSDAHQREIAERLVEELHDAAYEHGASTGRSHLARVEKAKDAIRASLATHSETIRTLEAEKADLIRVLEDTRRRWADCRVERDRRVSPDDQQNGGDDGFAAELPRGGSTTAQAVETDNGRGVTSAGGESGLPPHPAARIKELEQIEAYLEGLLPADIVDHDPVDAMRLVVEQIREQAATIARLTAENERLKAELRYDEGIRSLTGEGAETVAQERRTPESASAALYGFMGWLTSRDAVSGPFSSTHGATTAADLVAAFCKSQGYAEPPEDFHKNLKPYPTMEDCYALTECKSALRRAGFTDEAQG